VVLVGWSFGGAVVANAAVGNENVVGVALIASQLGRAEAVAQLSPRQSLLLVHGLEDGLLPAAYSQQLFELAACPKELRFTPGDHFFYGHEAALTRLLSQWCCSLFPTGPALAMNNT
jgi:alpha/beta superfamily hydrolase